jgi:hypothetical protein
VGKTKGKSRGKSTAKPAQPARTAKAPRSRDATLPNGPHVDEPAGPAPPPLPRDELLAPRDVARLLRYGERFGARKIDVRMMPLQLPVRSGGLAIVDPGAPKSWRVLDRPAGIGQFRVMLSIASGDGDDRLAAIVIHVGRPPIARWSVAHFAGQKRPKSADQLPRAAVTTGWIAVIDAGEGSPGAIAVPPAQGLQPIDVPLTDGRRALALPCGNGEFASYWAVDAADKPICLVIDFDVFTLKEWKARPISS